MRSDALSKCSGMADLKAVKLRGTRGRRILCNQRVKLQEKSQGKITKDEKL